MGRGLGEHCLSELVAVDAPGGDAAVALHAGRAYEGMHAIACFAACQRPVCLRSVGDQCILWLLLCLELGATEETGSLAAVLRWTYPATLCWDAVRRERREPGRHEARSDVRDCCERAQTQRECPS